MLPDPPASPPPLLWDEPHLKALLRRPQYPARLIELDPWHGWIEARGGLSAVQAYLKTCDLLPHHRRILDLFLTTPNAFGRFYAHQLNVSYATYFRHLRELLSSLSQHLNAWEAETPRPALPRSNLPARFTSLIGREQPLQDIRTCLARPQVRLLTLTGPGGIGKTRLALEAATGLLEAEATQKGAWFPDGIFFVALAQVRDPTWVAERVAQALGLTKTGHQTPADHLNSYLRERRLLLVLDNLEHLPAAASLLADWLAAAPGLRILATSRAVLNIYGEYVFSVPPLNLPPPQSPPALAELAESQAVRLFVERARAAVYDFVLTPDNAAAVAEICIRLDGLPLAIELAAARVHLFSPQEMLPYLERRLAFLKSETPDAPERSLRGTIDWSYELLSGAEQSLFCRLAVFVGGWTRSAIQAVCGNDPQCLATLESLLNKSLVRRQRSDLETRFEMLETVREYALERLQASGDADTRRRHAAYYLALAQAAEPEFARPEQKQWLERLEIEHDNLRAALDWLLEHQEAEPALQLTGALWMFWHIRGYQAEGRRWVERTLAQGAHVRSAARVNTLYGGGWLYLEDTTRMGQLFVESLDLARALGDRRLIALALQGQGESLQRRRLWAEARAHFEESLALMRELGDDQETAWVLDHLGRLAWEQEDYGRAEALFHESLRLFRKVGQLWGIAHSFERLGAVNMGFGNYESASAFLHESLVRFRALGDRWQIELVLEHAGLAALKQGEFVRARALLLDSLRLNAEAKNLQGVARSLAILARLAEAQGDEVRASRLYGAIHELRDEEGAALMPLDEKDLADIRSRREKAARTVAWAEGQAMSLEEVLAYAANSS